MKLRRAGRVRMLVLGVWICCTSVATLAEVGVIRDVDRPHLGYPYVQTIVDEPDPLGTWTRISALSDARRVLLNPDGDLRGDGPPAVAYHSAWRLPLVVWSRAELSGPRKIVVSYFVGGEWSAPQRINSTPGDQRDPAVVVAPDGTLHVAYWQVANSSYSVFHQSLAVFGDAWSPPMRVSGSGLVACRPSLAAHGGGLRFVFETHPNGPDTTPKNVVLAEWADAEVLPQVVAVSANTRALWPQVHSRAGKLWVDWIDFTNGGAYIGEMAWTQAHEDGDWTPVEYVPFTSQEQLEYHVRGSIKLQVFSVAPADQTPRTTP